MNTLEGLKKLLKKLGGDPDAVSSNGDAVDAIAEAYTDNVGAVIDDTKSSKTTVYSSKKIESLIPSSVPTEYVMCYLEESEYTSELSLMSEDYELISDIFNAVKNGNKNIVLVGSRERNFELNLENCITFTISQIGADNDNTYICISSGLFIDDDDISPSEIYMYVGIAVQLDDSKFRLKKQTFSMD